VGNKQ